MKVVGSTIRVKSTLRRFSHTLTPFDKYVSFVSVHSNVMY